MNIELTKGELTAIKIAMEFQAENDKNCSDAYKGYLMQLNEKIEYEEVKEVEKALKKAIDLIDNNVEFIVVPIGKIDGVCEYGMWGIEISKMKDGEYWVKLRVSWDGDREDGAWEKDIHDSCVIRSISTSFMETIESYMSNKRYVKNFKNGYRFTDDNKMVKIDRV